MNANQIEKKKYVDEFIGSVLLNYNFQLFFDKTDKIGIIVTYKHPNGLFIRFVYELFDCVFNFLIYKLRKDKFYKEKMFWKIFQEMDPTLEYDTIQPTGRDYLPALKKNSELLEQFLDQLFNHGRTDLIKEILE